MCAKAPLSPQLFVCYVLVLLWLSPSPTTAAVEVKCVDTSGNQKSCDNGCMVQMLHGRVTKDCSPYAEATMKCAQEKLKRNDSRNEYGVQQDSICVEGPFPTVYNALAECIHSGGATEDADDATLYVFCFCNNEHLCNKHLQHPSIPDRGPGGGSFVTAGAFIETQQPLLHVQSISLLMALWSSLLKIN